jgi:hypothetical protein
MRKSWIFIIALTTLGFLAGEASADRINISGRHSQGEIKATCGAVGGDFFSNSSYG